MTAESWFIRPAC